MGLRRLTLITIKSSSSTILVYFFSISLLIFSAFILTAIVTVVISTFSSLVPATMSTPVVIASIFIAISVCPTVDSLTFSSISFLFISIVSFFLVMVTVISVSSVLLPLSVSIPAILAFSSTTTSWSIFFTLKISIKILYCNFSNNV